MGFTLYISEFLIDPLEGKYNFDLQFLHNRTKFPDNKGIVSNALLGKKRSLYNTPPL